MILKWKVQYQFTKEEKPPQKKLIGIVNNINQRLKLTHIHGTERMIKQVNLPLGNIDTILDKYNRDSSCQQKGKSFEGLINYLFEGRLKDKGAVNKCTEIISYSDNSE